MWTVTCKVGPENTSFALHTLNERGINIFIIQQIVPMTIHGKEALNICHPYMTDILRYT